MNEIRNTIALTKLSGLTLANLHELYTIAGSATDIIENRNHFGDIVPDAQQRTLDALANTDEALHFADVELEWCQKNKIEAICFNDPRYPSRLRDCDDAPLVLYYRGSAELNARRVISIIGTRHCTPYGQDVIQHFMQDMKNYCPDVLVMSGLAYGVDINAHRQALKNGFPTIGVLAHGLDMIYPNAHRQTAIEMLSNGGLLTEYPSQTVIDKRNFLQRNRIVAGMADASILVESAKKGGGLVTMRIARDYHRDTFAFPGPVNAEYSKGCNNLIRDNGASLITSAEDFVAAMGWIDDKELSKAKNAGIERQMFLNLTEEEQRVVDLLQKTNDLQINIISVKTSIPIHILSSMLFQLEMNGVLRVLAGGCYHLI